jgi:MutS domain III.
LFYSKLIQINRDEKLALDEVFEQFDPGAEFTDPDHSYSCDLDLFGIGSLFQFINRTTTPSGKIKLAAYLTNLVADADLIEQKQKALQELSDNTRWRQHFSAKGPGNHDQPLQFWDQQTMWLNLTTPHP